MTMQHDSGATQFYGGPCDGLATPNNYGGRKMIFYRRGPAFYLYERTAPKAFEFWGAFPDDEAVHFEDEQFLE